MKKLLSLPSLFVNPKFYQLSQILAGTILLSLCSLIKIPLPFSIIPITLQTFFVLLLGCLIGKKNAAYAVIGYWAQILIGLPVLAGGIVNPLIFLGPKGGYYIGMFFQAYIMGWVVEKFGTQHSLKIIAGGVVACGIQLFLGVSWLAFFVGMQPALLMGLYPFIFGEFLKILMVNSLIKRT